MYLGLGLLYVGAVLVLNGIWLLGYIQDHEIWVINFFTGGLVVFVALYSAFEVSEPDQASLLAAAQFLLFAFTYPRTYRIHRSETRKTASRLLFLVAWLLPAAILTAVAAWREVLHSAMHSVIICQAGIAKREGKSV